MSYTTPNDYKGRFAITRHTTNIQKIQDYINDVEPSIMNELLGVELYALFVQGVEDEEEIYTKLYNEFFENLHCGLVESKGIIDMLKGFVYWNYYTEDYASVSAVGNTVKDGENSTRATDIEANLYTRYNSSVKTYRAIQTYILANLDVYPAFKGVHKQLINWF